VKFLSRLLMAFAIIFSLTVVQITPVKASSTQSLTLTPAESFVRTALLTTGKADLADFSQAPQDHIIRGEFILQLWRDDPDLQKITNFEIDHATIRGNIEAQGLSLPFSVEFFNCTFLGRINMESTNVKAFRIDYSTVTDSVRMGRMVAEGDVALYQSIFKGEVTLFGADLKKQLLAKGSYFDATKPDSESKYPFELWTTHVGQTTEFTNAVIMGEASAEDGKFDGDLKFNGVTFAQPAHFTSVKVGNIADFQQTMFKDKADFDSSTVGLNAIFTNTTFNSAAIFSNFRAVNLADFTKATFNNNVTFASSVMERDATFTHATFNGTATFDDMTITRYFNFDNATLNRDFSVQYSTIGWPYFASTTFNGKVTFEGVQASNDFEFTDASYNFTAEPFTVTLAKVNGAGLFGSFSAPAGLKLTDSQFGSLSISGMKDDAPNSKFRSIVLDATTVDGSLDLEDVNADTLSAQGFSAKDSTTFNNVSVLQDLNLSNSSFGVFTLDKNFWPVITNKPDAFNLHGMSYTDIVVSPEINDNNWETLAQMANASSYSPQTYFTLEQFLTEKGHPEWAAQVELQRKIRERDTILKNRDTGSWLWSWFMYLFSGYGQIPALALVWSALVIAIGAILYWKEEYLVVIDDTDAKPPYNPFLYSFAMFVPFIELDLAEKWEPKPERRVAWIFKYVLKILGWILTPIALLTFGGIIK
jgi:pentapeptide repeat protein